MKDKTSISVVIPVFNEASNIYRLTPDLVSVLAENFEAYEVIYVDDGSTDETVDLLRKMNRENSKISCISLSRNFGHQAALKAGLDVAFGDVVVTMDGDGQNPPEIILSMMENFHEGFEIVNTRRSGGRKEKSFKRVTAKLFYSVFNKMASTKIPVQSSDFRLMSKRTVKEFSQLMEKSRFSRGLVSWLGFRQITIEFKPPKRSTGKTKYSSGKMLGLALDALTSFTSRPLRTSLFIGSAITLLGFFYAIYAFIMYTKGDVMQGWTSIMIVVLLIGGFNMIAIGLVGEYLSKVFTEVKQRPIYIVKERIGHRSLESESDM